MEEIFDNRTFLNNITPNTSQIFKYKTERNWAIGIAVGVLVISGIIIVAFEYKHKKAKDG